MDKLFDGEFWRFVLWLTGVGRAEIQVRDFLSDGPVVSVGIYGGIYVNLGTCSHQLCIQEAGVRGNPAFSAGPDVASSPAPPAGRL